MKLLSILLFSLFLGLQAIAQDTNDVFNEYPAIEAYPNLVQSSDSLSNGGKFHCFPVSVVNAVLSMEVRNSHLELKKDEIVLVDLMVENLGETFSPERGTTVDRSIKSKIDSFMADVFGLRRLAYTEFALSKTWHDLSDFSNYINNTLKSGSSVIVGFDEYKNMREAENSINVIRGHAVNLLGIHKTIGANGVPEFFAFVGDPVDKLELDEDDRSIRVYTMIHKEIEYNGKKVSMFALKNYQGSEVARLEDVITINPR